MNDSTEHFRRVGGNHKQLSFREVVQDSADCEYILRAVECFEEGKVYLRSGEFSSAMTKFFLAVQHLMTKSPDVETPIAVNGRHVVNYVLQKCEEYGEEVSGYCAGDDSGLCSMKDFNARKLHQKLKEVAEETNANVHIRGVECALLCHIVTILHTCKVALHLEEQAAALAIASNRLTKLLYEDQTLKTSCSLGSLTKYFEPTNHSTDTEIEIMDKDTEKAEITKSNNNPTVFFRGSSDRTKVSTWIDTESNNKEEENGPTTMVNMYSNSNDTDGECEEEIEFFSFAE